MNRLILVPRLGGRADTDWYPWLLRKLEERRRVDLAEVLVMPAVPHPGVWRARVRSALGADPTVLRDTVLIGHSLGCQAILGALAELPFGHQVGGALFVAGWWRLEAGYEALQPWVEARPDLRRASGALRRRAALLGTQDAFAPDLAENRRVWERELDCQVVVAPGGAHFTRSWEPAVLDALEPLLPEPLLPAR